MDAVRLRGHPDLDEPLHLRHRRRPPGDARRHRRRARSTSCSTPCPRACGSAARSTSRPASRSRRSTRACATSPPATSRTEDEISLPRRRDVRPLRPEPDRLDPLALGVPDALHALPARDLPGRAAGDVRVPDRDLRADRPAGLQRVASTRARARSPPPPTWRSCTTSARASSSRAGVHPHARETLATTSAGWGTTIEEIPLADGVTDRSAAAAIGDDVSAVLVQYPNFLGAVEDLAAAHRRRPRGRRADDRRCATR